MVYRAVELSVAQVRVHHQSVVLQVCWYKTASACRPYTYCVQANYANMPMFGLYAYN